MVERQEVEALLKEAREGGGLFDGTIDSTTLAALCRAWLAVDGAQVGVVEEYGRNSGKWYLDIRLDELPDGMIHERVRIVKEAGDA